MTTTQHSSTKRDILDLLMRQGQATAQDLAGAVGVSPQAIRRHLKDLEEEGLITHQSQVVGMGRPQHIYTLSRQGRDQFPDRYGEFAVDLLKTLSKTLGQEQLGQILQQQWQQKAHSYQVLLGHGSLEERVARLVALRRAEGFMAEMHRAEDFPGLGDQGFVVTEHNCAIAVVAESFPRVCDHELDMFGLALPDCRVDRTHWLVDGQHQCGYLIQPR